MASAFDAHDGVNIHVDWLAIKTALKAMSVALETRAMNVTITARKAADFVGEQHPKERRQTFGSVEGRDFQGIYPKQQRR